jgi:membrane protease YdiL (CAAX protease family)
MPVNAFLIEWNKHLQLPDGLAWLEKHLQLREQKGAHLTTLLTTFASPGQLLAGFFVIAIIPAFGEEFFFRGILQTSLTALSKNKHVAIVCTGALFSFFHFQFYGFLPRMLQGVLFGYLFYWSKDLCYPVIAHLINNGFTVVMHYFWQHGLIKVNITDTAAVPLSWSFAGLLLAVVLIFTLRRYFSRHLMPNLSSIEFQA